MKSSMAQPLKEKVRVLEPRKGSQRKEKSVEGIVPMLLEF